MARVVVVGAGFGGLAVAARLAKLGHAVTVCEQAGQVGGKLAGLRLGEYVWDTGPTLLTLPAVVRDLFRKSGRPLERELELVPLPALARYRFPDGTWLDLPNTGVDGVAAALDDAFGAGGDWTRLMDRAAAMWDATRRPFLESTPTAGDLVRLALDIRALRTVAPWSTLRGLGTHYLRDPRARMLLDRYATYSGSDPRRAPGVLAVVPWVEQTFGGWHVRGGLHRLALALRDRLDVRGVSLRLACDVVSVSTEGGRVDGVLLASGERLAADVVVSDADARLLYGSLVRTPAARRPLRRLRKLTPSASAFVLLLGLRGRTPHLAHHTVLFGGGYDAEFDALFSAPAQLTDPTVYVCSPDDDTMRPADGESLMVLVNAPAHGHGHGGVNWTAPGMADAYADVVLDVLAARGLDVRGRIVHRLVRTPADIERDTRSPGGSIYGASSNGRRAAFLRPANRSPVPGLFLVGGSAHPGGGLPLVGLSAAAVANLVGPA